MSSANSGGGDVSAPKPGHLLDSGIQIYINDVTVDANGDDYGEDVEAMEMDQVKKQWRRSSWCPVEGRKKEEKHEKQKMILSVAGKSQSLSSLEGDDDDDSDEGNDSAEIGRNNKSQVAAVRHNKNLPAAGTNRPTETQHLPEGKTPSPANGEATEDCKQGNSTSQKVGRASHRKLKKNTSSFGLGNKENSANAKRSVLSDSCQAAVKGSCDRLSEDKGQCHRLSQESTDPGRKGYSMCVLESARFSPSGELTEVSRTRNASSLPPMVSDHVCPPFLSSPLATCSEDAAVEALTLNDQPIQNRILLKQTLLEIHRFISRQNSPITELLDEDENVCSECGCDKFSSRSKAETLKVDSPAKQIVCTGDGEIEEPSGRDGKQPKIKQHGSVFSKLGSYRQKKASNVSVGETLQEKSSSVSEGLTNPKTPPQAIKDKRTSQVTSDRNLNSSPPRTTTTGSAVKTTSVNAGHFQWRRVATKLGIDRAISEDHQKECDLTRESGEESHSCHSLVVDLQSMIDIHSSSIESLEDEIYTDVNDEFDLFLMENEPEAWSVTVDKKTLKKMTAKNIKRQDHIWEFVQTEKSHCRTLKIMHKVFADGMLRELNLSKDMVDRIFPRLDDLLDIHLTFLNRLLVAQRRSVDRSIHDIGHTLQQQFESQMAEKMKTAYGEFCSLQTEAIQLYKDLLKSDVAFQAFIKKCSRNNQCKRLGIPECILLVTQRITKYSLLIEPIIKTTPENSPERRSLVHCVTIIREIIGHVERQIEARSKELRLFEVYNKLDARSTATLNGNKFKKSDLLSNKRKLIHDGPIKWMSARGKPFEVLVVILSDVIFFLAENNQKCNFFSQDNKSSVISLAKLIVREKGDTKDSKGMYLICQSKTEPEMYEFICKSADDRRRWIEIIREAINNCSEDGEPSACEEERKLQEATDARLRQLIDQLHHKDIAVAIQCREKMGIALEILEIFAKDDISNYLKTERDHETWKIFMPESIMQSIFVEATRLFALMQPVTRCISIMQNCTAGDQECRELETTADRTSISCTILEHLEKPSSEETYTKQSESMSEEAPLSIGTESQTQFNISTDSSSREVDDFLVACVPGSLSQLDLSMTREQCMSLAKILQRVHQLVCLSSCQTTELESMFGQLADANGKITRLQAENERLSRERKLPSYHPDKQLEELRTLQSSIQQQKMDLEHTRLEHTTAVNQQRDELLQMQRAIDQEREKIQRQKDELARQRETLKQQLHLFEDQRIGSVKGYADLGQTGSVENLAERRHFRTMYEESLMGRMSQAALPYAVHQTMMSGISHQRCMSYDLLKCSDSSPLDSGDERTPLLADRPECSGKASYHSGASKSITRMHSMSAVPSSCLSPPGGICRRRSILLPVQLQRTAAAEQKPAESAKPKKSMSRSSSKDSDSSPSRKSSRISSIASPSSLSSKLLAAFSSRMPLAAELLRLSKDRSTSLTSVASASQSMPSSPQSMLRRHAEGLDGRSPSKYEHAVGHSLSSSPPLNSESHVLKKKLFSTLSTGNFLPLKLAECRRPKSASASPQHSSVVALKLSKHAKRTLSGSQESIHSTKTASATKETDVFYI